MAKKRKKGGPITDIVKKMDTGSFSAKAARAGMSTKAYAEQKKSAPGKLGKQARLAKTLMKHGKKAKK